MSAAPERTDGALPYVPAREKAAALRGAAAGCRGCPLYEDATQTVSGAGPGHRFLW